MRLIMRAATAALHLVFGVCLAAATSTPLGLAQPTERTVFDATVLAIPPRIGAPCIQIGAGGLTVRARTVPQPRALPATLRLWGYRDGIVAVSATLPPSADAWCWSIEIEAPPDVASAGDAERGTYAQLVSLTMTTSSP